MRKTFLKQAKIKWSKKFMGMVMLVAKILIILGRPLTGLMFSVLLFCKKFKFDYKKGIIYLFFSIFLIGLTMLGMVVYYEVKADLPQITKIYLPPQLSTKIVDQKGELLYKFYVGENRSWISLAKIPQSLVWATIAVEDKDFYQHPGFSPKGLLQAMWYNIKTKGENGLRGGSTITQQLVKNVFLTKEKTWQRKFREIILSVLVEWRLDKNQILERYFNQVPYGGEIYGAQEAAIKYFGKNVWELTMAEAAFLAGIPAAPTTYSPYGDNINLAYSRQRYVLDEMVKSGFITAAKGEELKKIKLVIKNDKTIIKDPHFVFYVKDYLAQHFSLGSIERGGFTITTSIDNNVQQMSENIVKEELSKVERLRISNGAALIVNVKNGDIMSMVGSKDYFATDIDGKYNVTTALRQPGSSIKPINYLLAIEKGKTLMSTVDDKPVSYPIRGQKTYTPQNYNGKYMGTVTIKTALASSLNIPSVKLLAENGIDNMALLGQKMGITTWNDQSRWGLSLALGSNEVKMIDMASAYSIFANMGESIEINPILKIEDYSGQVIWKKEVKIQQIIPEEEAFLINSILSDDNARSPIFGLNSKLKIGGKTVAVKTGTTNSLKDNWCIGWTSDYLVAAWVGNNDGTPMSWVASGVSGATPIWNRIMNEMIKDKPNKPWSVPSGVSKKTVCGKEEYFIEGTEKSVKCRAVVTPTKAPNP